MMLNLPAQSSDFVYCNSSIPYLGWSYWSPLVQKVCIAGSCAITTHFLFHIFDIPGYFGLHIFQSKWRVGFSKLRSFVGALVLAAWAASASVVAWTATKGL
eukprot:6107155-Amphidinium_carterae.1